MGFCLSAIRGWWKKKKCVWRSFLLLVIFKMSKINLLGLLLVSMVLTLIVLEDFYGKNWLVCSIGGTCHGALGERLGEAHFCSIMVEFSDDFIFQGLINILLFYRSSSSTMQSDMRLKECSLYSFRHYMGYARKGDRHIIC
jgi:hypothetical protein